MYYQEEEFSEVHSAVASVVITHRKAFDTTAGEHGRVRPVDCQHAPSRRRPSRAPGPSRQAGGRAPPAASIPPSLSVRDGHEKAPVRSGGSPYLYFKLG